jgi:hypothetical protein
MQKVTFYEIEAILFFTFLTRGKTSSCVSTCHFVYYVIAFIVMGFLCSDSIYVTPSSKKCRLLKRGNLKETGNCNFEIHLETPFLEGSIFNKVFIVLDRQGVSGACHN